MSFRRTSHPGDFHAGKENRLGMTGDRDAHCPRAAIRPVIYRPFSGRRRMTAAVASSVPGDWATIRSASAAAD